MAKKITKRTFKMVLKSPEDIKKHSVKYSASGDDMPLDSAYVMKTSFAGTGDDYPKEIYVTVSDTAK